MQLRSGVGVAGAGESASDAGCLIAPDGVVDVSAAGVGSDGAAMSDGGRVASPGASPAPRLPMAAGSAPAEPPPSPPQLTRTPETAIRPPTANAATALITMTSTTSSRTVPRSG